MVPHGDRSGVVIEPWLTDQWYCNAETLAKPAIEAVESGSTRVRAAAVGEHVLRLDAQHPALVHLAPALVGASDPGLVRPGRPRVRRRDRGGGARRRRARITASAVRADARRGRARHLVLLGAVAVLDAGLAGADARARALLSGRRAGHRLRHHLLLGRADDDDGPALHGRGAVPHRLHPRPGARRARPEDVEVEGQRHRSAGADRPLRRRCAALHLRGAGRAGPRRQARREPRRGLPQFRHQAVERRAVCRDERLRADRRVSIRGAPTLTVNRWIAGALGALRRRASPTALEDFKFNEAARRALPLHLGHLLRLVCRIHQADPAGRGRGRAAPRRGRRPPGCWRSSVHLLHPIMPFITEELWQHLAGEARGMLIAAPGRVHAGLGDPPPRRRWNGWWR